MLSSVQLLLICWMQNQIKFNSIHMQTHAHNTSTYTPKTADN